MIKSFCAYDNVLYISQCHISELIPYLSESIKDFEVNKADQGQIILRDEVSNEFHVVGSTGALNHFKRLQNRFKNYRLIQTSKGYNVPKTIKIVNLFIYNPYNEIEIIMKG